jgi:hypothetical protein
MGDKSGGPRGPPGGGGGENDVDMLNSEQLNNANIMSNNTNNTQSLSNTYQNSRNEEIFLYEDKDDGPYFVFLESLDQNQKGAGRMHPMSIGQLLKKHFPNIEILKLIKNGRNRVKIQVPSRDKANKIIQSSELKHENFKAYVPRFILFRQGIIRNVDKNLTEQDLLEEITPLYNMDAKVTGVRRFNRRIFDEQGKPSYVPTGTIQVTFRAQSIPTHVSIYYVRCEVEKYVPKVLQCTNCLRFGHTATFCKGSVRCSRCGENHPDNECDNTTEQKCIHCNGPHSSRVNFKNPVCPEVEKQKSIKNLMVTENITFFEAKTQLSSSYSAAATSSQARPNVVPREQQQQSQSILRIPSIRRQIFAPVTPERSQTKKRLRQESPQNQHFQEEYQKLLQEYRYDQNQFPNGACLKNKNTGNDNQNTTKCTLEFENVENLSNFICTVIKQSVGLVGSSRKISQNELTGIIQKELLNKTGTSKDVHSDIFSEDSADGF